MEELIKKYQLRILALETRLESIGDPQMPLAINLASKISVYKFILADLENVPDFHEKWQIVAKQKIELLKLNEGLTQRLIDAGLEKPAIHIDLSRNA